MAIFVDGAGSALLLFAPLLMAQSDLQRLPPEHPNRGLPCEAAIWLPYASSSAHVANRIFCSMYLDRCIPSEVGGALIRERSATAEFFVPGWYFQKRPGVASDAHLFGGDGRQMPREGFAKEESAGLQDDLGAIDGALLAGLRGEPRLAVYFQNDLLRLVRRLMDTGQNRELISPLLACAHRLALPAVVLAKIAPNFAMADFQKVFPEWLADGCVEVERRSSQLFNAQNSLAWSSVFVQWPQSAEPNLDAWLCDAVGAKDAPHPIPVGTLALLVQGLVALDEKLVAHAVPIIIDVRLQRLSNRDPLRMENATTTHDGIDFRLWQMPRQVLRESGAASSFADFRELNTEDHELFRDYGTRKHTTIAAQCSLCHRRTDGPEEALAGFSALRPSSNPRRVTDKGERWRLAETEVARFLAEANKACTPAK
ncbi:MAG: hypothetical protein EXS02_05640 [Planctomycetes bacterium]|nr:hypothetical protein [Planctomycetota bacterium]